LSALAAWPAELRGLATLSLELLPPLELAGTWPARSGRAELLLATLPLKLPLLPTWAALSRRMELRVRRRPPLSGRPRRMRLALLLALHRRPLWRRLIGIGRLLRHCDERQREKDGHQ
jgi:hypothetical protein